MRHDDDHAAPNEPQPPTHNAARAHDAGGRDAGAHDARPPEGDASRPADEKTAAPHAEAAVPIAVPADAADGVSVPIPDPTLLAATRKLLARVLHAVWHRRGLPASLRLMAGGLALQDTAWDTWPASRRRLYVSAVRSMLRQLLPWVPAGLEPVVAAWLRLTAPLGFGSPTTTAGSGPESSRSSERRVSEQTALARVARDGAVRARRATQAASSAGAITNASTWWISLAQSLYTSHSWLSINAVHRLVTKEARLTNRRAPGRSRLRAALSQCVCRAVVRVGRTSDTSAVATAYEARALAALAYRTEWVVDAFLLPVHVYSVDDERRAQRAYLYVAQDVVTRRIVRGLVTTAPPSELVFEVFFGPVNPDASGRAPWDALPHVVRLPDREMARHSEQWLAAYNVRVRVDPPTRPRSSMVLERWYQTEIAPRLVGAPGYRGRGVRARANGGAPLWTTAELARRLRGRGRA